MEEFKNQNIYEMLLRGNEKKQNQIKNNIYSNKFKFTKLDYSNNYYVMKKDKLIPLPPNEEIIKNASKYAKQNMLSCFIQNLFEKEEDEDIDEMKNKIFESLKPNIFDLSQDFYGNYVIQGILDKKDPAKTKIIFDELIKKDILSLCSKAYGCRVIQKLIDSVDANKVKEILGKIKNNLNELFLNQNGNHVIQKIIEKINEDSLEDIYNAVLEKMDELIKNIYGSRIIQKLFDKLNSEEKKTKMIEKIYEMNLIELCKDQYSNYILQLILDNYKEKYIDKTLGKIKGNIKEFLSEEHAIHASYIIEKIIIYGNENQKKEICDEIIENDNKTKDFISNLMKDKNCNYIIQKIIDNCPEEEIIKRIKGNIPKEKKDIKGNYTYIYNNLKENGFVA